MQTTSTFFGELFSSDRLKSFLWRGGAIGLVAVLGYAQQNLTQFAINPSVLIVIGVALGEVTKALNNYLTNANSLS